MGKKKSTKERLLNKALVLFVRQGYERTTLKDIAGAVGIQAPSIYYYFKSKKDLLHQLYQKNWNTFERRILKHMLECSDPEERINIYIRSMIRFQFRSAEETVFMDTLSKKFMRARKIQDRMVFELIRDTLEEIAAIKAPAKTTDPTLGAFSLFGMILNIYKWYRPRGRINLDELIQQITIQFFGGFYGGSIESVSTGTPPETDL